MKSRILFLLTFILIVLLLTACRPLPPKTQVPQPPTVIIEDESAAATRQPNEALDGEMDYSIVPPGTVFFLDEQGMLAHTRIVPELSQPEWDASDFPKGFTTTLIAGHWKKFLLGPAELERGYLVDVTPQEASTEEVEVVTMVMPEYDGESWVDLLWLFQPKEASPLPLNVQVYTTQGWPIIFQNRLSLEPGVLQGYPLAKSSDRGGYVAEVSPLGAGTSGDTLQRIMINPDFSGGWQDTLQVQIPQSQAPMQADVTIYQVPSAFREAELTPHLQPGEWYTVILGLSEQQAAYVMRVTPLNTYDVQVEYSGVQPVFMGGVWMDVLRLRIPADRPAMDVNVLVSSVGLDSHPDIVDRLPTTTPDLLATELAANFHATATPAKPAILPSTTPLPSELSLAGCPGALPSRLQSGGSGFVSQDPPVANRVRSEPDRDAEILGQIMPGEKFTILEGPICADGWAWWRVRSRAQELEGWTSEGDAETYWLVPFHLDSTDLDAEQNGVTLTADQLDSADDIEAAIKRATMEGNQPGTVILDGRKGAFVFTGDDRSLNIFVSDLTLRGVNQAVIQNCGDGLYFDNFPLKNILVEGIEFICEGNGVAGSGAFENVTLRNNIFRAGRTGIGLGGASSAWSITENVIESGWSGIEITGAEKVLITNNQISSNTGIILRQCTGSQVEKNTIQASDQGVLLAQESWKNWVQMNTIEGVNRSGIALEASVTGNQVLGNKVSCAPGASCLTIDAAPDVAKMNTISPIKEEHLAYSNDFEKSAGVEWSHHHIEISPTGKKFLGQFGNDEVSLNLANLPEHTEIRVTFEVYLIRSWDGNINPDIWQFKVDGRSLLLTTFDNQDYYSDHSQAYPDNYPQGSHPPRTGAKEVNTLGYEFDHRPLDTVYLLSFTIPHASPTVKLTFSAKGLMADLLDESWGIDNVAIYTIK